MGCNCVFEPKVPIDCIRDTYTALTNGDYGRGKVLKCTGCSLGQIGALIEQLRGPDDTPVFSAEPIETPDDMEACLELLMSAAQESPAPGAAGSNPLIDALLAKVVALLLEKLQEWLNS